MEHFDRARLETDDDDSSFPPTEPVSFSARPTSSFRPGAERPSGDGVEQGFWNAAPTSKAPEPLLSLPAQPQRPKPSPERAAFTRVLFAAIFGSLTLLLFYALLHRVIG